MKLQNLIIIFIIIIIPIVSIFTLYLNLETKTIVLQTDYDEKLIEATKEAMSAFEINTTEWNSEYSTLANSKRQDILSSVNVFVTSLSDKLRIGGTSRESILTYVPAIIFTMYDGYYIYGPTYVPQNITDDKGVQLFYYDTHGYEGTKITALATQNIGGTIVSGKPIYFAKSGEGTLGTYNSEGIYYTTDIDKAEKTYKHVLKTFVPYTTNYELNGENYVINYTLDNYIRVYSENDSREGYIIENFYDGATGERITIPVNSVSGIKIDDTTISLEYLSENIAIKNSATGIIEVKEYNYIYNSNNDKRYYDSTTGKFFTLNKNSEKVYLPETDVGGTLAEYKKVLVRPNQHSWEYLELYQILNGRGSNNTWYYIDSNNQYIEYTLCDNSVKNMGKAQDCSAINYYVENYDFNYWLIDMRFDTEQILSQKNETIINNINNNLNLSVSNYSANSRIDYQIPKLLKSDWEQALSNISMIAFLQGAKIGLKTYNNYAIVTSTENNEFVSEDSLYYLGGTSDLYYHRYYCSKGTPYTHEAYRNTEYKVKSYDSEGTVKYYFKHYNSSNAEVQACFDCIVNRNNYNKTTNIANQGFYDRVFYNALARERYIQMQRTRLTDTNAITYTLEVMNVAHNITTIGNSRSIALAITGGSGSHTINWKYRVSNVGAWVDATSAINQILYSSDKTYYVQYTVTDTVTGETVTNTIPGETIPVATEFNVTYTQSGSQVNFTITGGTSPYKYQIQPSGGLWGAQMSIVGNTLTRTIPQTGSLKIRFMDSAGATKTLTVSTGAHIY